VNAADLPCGLLAFDDDLRILEANAYAASLLGTSSDELATLVLPAILSRGALIFFNTQVHPALAMLGHVDEIYLTLRSRAGDDVPVLLNGSRRDGRTTVAFVATRRRQVFAGELVAARDAASTATRLEQDAKEQARVAHSHLALRERLASLGTLVHGIAHEIANPLMIVGSNLDMLADDLRDARPLDRARLLELAEEGLDAAERIRAITRQMSQMVRADEMPRVVVDVRTVASLVVRMTKAQTLDRARVELSLGEVPLIDGDAGRLGQVLITSSSTPPRRSAIGPPRRTTCAWSRARPRTAPPSSRSPTTGPASPPTSPRASSSRSSPRSPWARARASGSPSRRGSCAPSGARSRSRPRSGAARRSASRSRCPPPRAPRPTPRRRPIAALARRACSWSTTIRASCASSPACSAATT
jgi:nitrogen-specific signal transduction histidine kinase